jgi:hypothetical protein
MFFFIIWKYNCAHSEITNNIQIFDRNPLFRPSKTYFKPKMFSIFRLLAFFYVSKWLYPVSIRKARRLLHGRSGQLFMLPRTCRRLLCPRNESSRISRGATRPPTFDRLTPQKTRRTLFLYMPIRGRGAPLGDFTVKMAVEWGTRSGCGTLRVH